MYIWGRELRCWKKGRDFLWGGRKTYSEAIQNLLKSWLSYGPPKEGRRVLMKKKLGRQQTEKVLQWNVKKKTFEGGLSKLRRTLRVWRSYRNCWMYLREYLVLSWLDLATKLHKYTPFAYSWSFSEECKKWEAVCVSNRGSDLNRMEQY